MINQNSPNETQFIASLQAVNQRLIQEIQERQRVEEALRESSERLRTILLTAKVQSSDQRKFALLGVSGLITKPFEPLTLAEQVAKIWGGDFN